MKHLQNTIIVLALGVLTAAAVFVGVEAVAGTAVGSAVTASATGSVQTCPATGCTASSCHATTGADPYSTGDASTGTNAGSGSSSETLTCPATGCTASSCHATSGGGRGAGNRWGQQGTGVRPELGDALSL